METITKYKATDGQVFETEKDCIAHEKKIENDPDNIINKINDFDDILKLNNIKKADFDKSNKGLEPDEIAYRQLKLIVKAYNQGWTPDWKNSNQAKWYPYFEYKESSFGFSHTAYAYWYTDTGVGSRLCLENEKRARDAGKKFEKIYNTFLSLTK